MLLETHLVNSKGIPVSKDQILQSLPMYLVGCLMLSSTDNCLPVQFEELIKGEDISYGEVYHFTCVKGCS